jgi:lipopolysaccharide export system protein LptA
MKHFLFKFYSRRKASLFLALFVVLIFGAKDRVFAQEKTGADEKKIHVTSDMLTSDNEAGFAEFSGNVRAAQGTTIIHSDRLRIYYKKGGKSAPSLSSGTGAVEKIVATGNVKINFDDKTAVSEMAEYMTETQVVILSGENTKVTTADESISGAKITLYRADGRVKVESGKGKRVEAILFDNGNTINE